MKGLNPVWIGIITNLFKPTNPPRSNACGKNLDRHKSGVFHGDVERFLFAL